jgi:hypothetical protein
MLLFSSLFFFQKKKTKEACILTNKFKSIPFYEGVGGVVN